MTDQEKIEKAIRYRKSYMMWTNVLGYHRKYGEKEFLLYLHRLIDSYHAFGSQSASDYSRESLEQFIKDEEV